jgi:hypothetical protein
MLTEEFQPDDYNDMSTASAADGSSSSSSSTDEQERQELFNEGVALGFQLGYAAALDQATSPGAAATTSLCDTLPSHYEHVSIIRTKSTAREHFQRQRCVRGNSRSLGLFPESLLQSTWTLQHVDSSETTCCYLGTASGSACCAPVTASIAEKTLA